MINWQPYDSITQIDNPDAKQPKKTSSRRSEDDSNQPRASQPAKQPIGLIKWYIKCD